MRARSFGLLPLLLLAPAAQVQAQMPASAVRPGAATVQEEAARTIARRREKARQQAVIRARNNAAAARALRQREAYIRKMTPTWTAQQLAAAQQQYLAAQVALQQQQLAIDAANAESQRRVANAIQQEARIDAYRFGAPQYYGPGVPQGPDYYRSLGVPR